MVEFFEEFMVSIVQPTIKKLSGAVHSWVTAGSQNSLILAGSAFREGKLTLPQFRGHPVTPPRSSLRTRPGNSSRAWSDDAADYRTPRYTQRCLVLLPHACGIGDGR